MQGSNIQWCDDTENPVMGCDGCELWPTVGQILAALVSLIIRFSSLGRREVRSLVKPIMNEYETATDVWHDMEFLLQDLRDEFPAVPESELMTKIEEVFRCYAGHLNLMWGGRSEHDPFPAERGYPPIFERPKKFPGRMAKTATRPDLRGTDRPEKPWLNGMPRLIFVSDMGDALSEVIDFDYLKTEIIDIVTNPAGQRHLWLWLTKRPGRMAEFAEWLLAIHGVEWPENLVPMTSVTNRATRSRIDQLRRVPAKLRGLSVEPLIESVELDLDGIDWVIVGGESGNYPREFDLVWARSLKRQCRDASVAFFMKQLGANPLEGDFPYPVMDSHGGNWAAWPGDLRVREFPEGFRVLTSEADKSNSLNTQPH